MVDDVVHTGDGAPVLDGTYEGQFYRDDLSGAVYRWNGAEWICASTCPPCPPAEPSVETPLPDAPVLDELSFISTSGFTVTWGPVDGATSYEIQVALDYAFENGVSAHMNQDLGNVTEVTFEDLDPGTLYYVRMRAKNETGYSLLFSNIVQAETTPMTPPMDFMSGLSHYYRFDGNGNDEIGGVNLVPHGTETYSSGAVGLGFDSNDGGSMWDDGGSINFSGYTYVLKINLIFSNTDDQTAWSWDGSGGIVIRIQSGVFIFGHYDGSWIILNGPSPSTYVTYKVVMMWNGSEFAAFIDGVKVASSSAGAAAATGAAMHVGTESWGFQAHGVQDELGIWLDTIMSDEMAAAIPNSIDDF